MTPANTPPAPASAPAPPPALKLPGIVTLTVTIGGNFGVRGPG